jgi:hypothetical protein
MDFQVEEADGQGAYHVTKVEESQWIEDVYVDVDGEVKDAMIRGFFNLEGDALDRVRTGLFILSTKEDRDDQEGRADLCQEALDALYPGCPLMVSTLQGPESALKHAISNCLLGAAGAARFDRKFEVHKSRYNHYRVLKKNDPLRQPMQLTFPLTASSAGTIAQPAAAQEAVEAQEAQEEPKVAAAQEAVEAQEEPKVVNIEIEKQRARFGDDMIFAITANERRLGTGPLEIEGGRLLNELRPGAASLVADYLKENVFTSTALNVRFDETIEKFTEKDVDVFIEVVLGSNSQVPTSLTKAVQWPKAIFDKATIQMATLPGYTAPGWLTTATFPNWATRLHNHNRLRRFANISVPTDDRELQIHISGA